MFPTVHLRPDLVALRSGFTRRREKADNHAEWRSDHRTANQPHSCPTIFFLAPRRISNDSTEDSAPKQSAVHNRAAVTSTWLTLVCDGD